MGFLRKRQPQPDSTHIPAGTAHPGTVRSNGAHEAEDPADDLPGYNPQRDEYLYWLTEEGYVIAQDVACQQEYLQAARCPDCGGTLVTVAQLNRGGQGLSEIVALCRSCRTRQTFIFDISNTVYQAWWSEQLGPLYIVQYDGPPREPVEPPD